MMTKRYFGVRAYFSPERIWTPMMVEDERGQAYHVRTMEIQTLDQFTTRYTVLLNGQETNLYHELDSEAWYMLRQAEQ